jgi:hypothetical protein
MLRMHWRYLCAVLRHKRFVYEEGRALGLGRWQCLIHDWSKFTPRMWGPYARAFYGPKNIKTGKPDGQPDFDAAWLWHQRVEPHHWQYYVLMEDSGKVHCLPIPDKYRRELLADWRGANRAYGDQSLWSWYMKTRPARRLHPETQEWLEGRLVPGYDTEA